MSLDEKLIKKVLNERELVLQIRKNGSSEQDVYKIIEKMCSLGIELNGTHYKLELDPKIVKVALRQYRAREELKKRGEYKERFEEKLKDLIERRKREIEDTYPNLLSVKIKSRQKYRENFTMFSQGYKCIDCETERASKVFAEIKYLKKNGIPTAQKGNIFFFYYCRRCGYIDYTERKV